MHGLFFTTLMDYLEQDFGLEVVDAAVRASNPASAAAYTAVSDYPHQELFSIITAAASRLGRDPAELLQQYGRRVFQALLQKHPGAVADAGDTLEFIATVDRHVHAEVQRRYPGARVPALTVSRASAGGGTVEYRSHRPLADVAAGMLQGCIDFFQDELTLQVDADFNSCPTHVRFRLLPRGAGAAP